MIDHTGLICAYHFDGIGNARAIGWGDFEAAEKQPGFLWIHLQQNGLRTRDWLISRSGLDPVVSEALLARQSRPRCTEFLNGLLLDLRGVNLDPLRADEEMASLHLWVDARRIISVRLHKILATRDIREQIAAGFTPRSVGGLLAELTHKLIDRVQPAVNAIDDELDELEHDMVSEGGRESRERLSTLRRRAVSLHRYISPQQTALSRLANERVVDIDERDRGRLRDTADDAGRFVADLDSIRERAVLIHEELVARVSDRMQTNMYLLSMVSIVFLPLTLLTGLLGINVAGIPGAHDDSAFFWVCVLLAIIGVLEVWFLRRKYWVRD
ncbi:zinc transporter ZntB [Iodidimonas sp. SYSU 1G8]|uniref:zinc transporter ZntB n=1 Tax=Iodidimonas sp. SYSU 1G8 TaxID=3133967 RepID=UPI0031FE9DD8